MKRRAAIDVSLPLSPEVAVAFADTVEVSLDCSFCQRTGRTVVFELGSESAQCFPGSARRADGVHPPFPGRVVSLDVTRTDREITASYLLEYDANPFVDARYGADVRPWKGYPTWARVTFDLTCPACSRTGSRSAQNNTARPSVHRCRCGHELCVEYRESPVLRWAEMPDGEWQRGG